MFCSVSTDLPARPPAALSEGGVRPPASSRYVPHKYTQSYTGESACQQEHTQSPSLRLALAVEHEGECHLVTSDILDSSDQLSKTPCSTYDLYTHFYRS